MPLVSVITCTYNRAHLIGETIQSVLSQNFEDFEYIIVDEGDDGTDRLVKSYNDHRLLYFKVANTQGYLSKLRNFGMRSSTGKYIAFVDSDDIWSPDKLVVQLNKLENDDSIGFSFTDIEMFDERGVFRKSIYTHKNSFCGSVFEDLVKNKFVICATTLLFRRTCLEKIGYQRENLKSGDFDFIISLAASFNAFAVCESKVKVRKHAQNLTHKLEADRTRSYLAPLHDLRNKGLVSNTVLDKTLSKLNFNFGVQFLKQHDYQLAISCLKESILHNKLSIKSYGRLAEALARSMLS